MFIEQPYENYSISRYLERKLDNAGLSRVEVMRTPVATRITLWVLNPGKIIGRHGATINRITDEIKREFPKIQEPQINIMEVSKPYLEPKIVAKKAAHFIEIGRRLRSVLHRLLNDIKRDGAIGAEIIASGKIGAKGARSKRLRVFFGYIPKAGDVVKYVRESHVSANTKSGVIGLFVRIVPPGVVFPDMELKMKREEERLKKATRTVTEDESFGKENETSSTEKEEKVKENNHEKESKKEKSTEEKKSNKSENAKEEKGKNTKEKNKKENDVKEEVKEKANKE